MPFLTVGVGYSVEQRDYRIISAHSSVGSMRVFYTKRMRWAREGFKGFGSLTVDSEG
jgi:hypothetical protein